MSIEQEDERVADDRDLREACGNSELVYETELAEARIVVSTDQMRHQRPLPTKDSKLVREGA